MLFTTYKFHEELFNKKYAIISPLILATTYLWFDYSHLATQDIIYSCLVTIGVLALVKIKSKKKQIIYSAFWNFDWFSFYDENFFSFCTVIVTRTICIYKKIYFMQ